MQNVSVWLIQKHNSCSWLQCEVGGQCDDPATEDAPVSEVISHLGTKSKS